MRGTFGNLEVDELTSETLAFLKTGSLGDSLRAYEKFKDDSNTDKKVLAELQSRIKKLYSAKFMQGIATDKILNEES